jgi:hypothetical protein
VPPTGVPKYPDLKGTLSDKAGTATTTLSIAADSNPQFGEVRATLGNLTANVRVRVLPKFPYKPDLSKIPDGVTMVGWVNAQGKFAVATVGGEKVIRKTPANPIPPVARANAFIGPPTLKDYSIECDIQAQKGGADMPDIGISASRYTLLLMGNGQELRLQSWEALPRIDKALKFPWDPNVWYKMKLTTEKVAGKNDVKVLGKVWPASAAEPATWTIEFTDPTPNTEGSPTIYANHLGLGAGIEMYFKNLQVTPK